MLARQARVLRGNACTRGAVAACTSGDLAIRNAALVNTLAQGDELFVFGKTGLGFLARCPVSDVAHVVIGQLRGKTLHHRIFAFTGFELTELLDQIFGMLACQLGVLGRARIAVCTVTGCAHSSKLLAAFGQIRLGHFGGCGGFGWSFGGGKSRRGKSSGKQEAGDEFHGESKVGMHNPLILQCFVHKNAPRLKLAPLHLSVSPASTRNAPMTAKASKKSTNPGPRSSARSTVVRAQQGKPSKLDPKTPLAYARNAPENLAGKEALAWLHTARFLTTAAQLHHLPPHDYPEFAFVGRSNAGKSTCINTLTQQKQLAYASKTPGRTQHINLFSIGRQGSTDAILADLPGYGYAAVNKTSKLRWQQVMANYLTSRENLAAVVLLCDPRLGLTELDEILLNVLRPRVEAGLQFVILLTKVDKLSKAEAAKALSVAKLQAGGGSVQLFSALKKVGVEDMALQLQAWSKAYVKKPVQEPVAGLAPELASDAVDAPGP